jgi:predicted PurR-regulated permease PerM
VGSPVSPRLGRRRDRGREPVRRHAAVLLGIVTFCAALAGFLYLGVAAQAGQVRVRLAKFSRLRPPTSARAESSFI